MPNNLAHFAIHADDVARVRRFYAEVFGWRFEAWGPPGFYMIRTGTSDNPGVQGAVVKRTEPLVGKGFYGFECSFSVEDVDKIAAAVEANGGKIVMPKVAIPTVGWLIKFEDTEGNLVGAIHYDQKAE